eukprot:scaffold43066_cov67-Phaeocystis_antarctica.AAC.8
MIGGAWTPRSRAWRKPSEVRVPSPPRLHHARVSSSSDTLERLAPRRRAADVRCSGRRDARHDHAAPPTAAVERRLAGDAGHAARITQARGAGRPAARRRR